MSIDIPDYTGWMRELTVDSKLYDQQKNISGGSSWQIFDFNNRDIELMHFELSTDYGGIQIELYVYDENASLQGYMRIPNYNGTTGVYPSPNTVYNLRSSLWQVLRYDTANSFYKVALTGNIRFCHGARLRIINPDSSQHSVFISLLLIDRGVLP